MSLLGLGMALCNGGGDIGISTLLPGGLSQTGSLKRSCQYELHIYCATYMVRCVHQHYHLELVNCIVHCSWGVCSGRLPCYARQAER